MPTDTTQMFWDYTRHLYILDVEYCKNTLGLDFTAQEGSLVRAKDRLYRISRQVHNYIYLHNATNRKFIEYNIAFDSDLRPIIQEALEWQARFEYESNALTMQNQIGVNLLNGIVINRKDIHGERLIHPETYNILLVNGLLYTGRYNTSMQEQDFDYDTLGY